MGQGPPEARPSPSPSPEPDEAPPSKDDSFLGVLRQVARAPTLEPVLPDSPAQGALIGRRLSHFRVLERIGAGGMGVVYKGEDERLRRAVALKVLPPSQAHDRARQQRLLREARSAAAVGHPNIAAIYEVGEEDGVAFIAMEYLEGRTLRAQLPGPPRPSGEVLRWAVQIAQGLARAHLAGIVHRDLKPDNVMLCRDGLIKILDFGLAKPSGGEPASAAPAGGGPARPLAGREESAPESSTRDGTVVGTPRYMSPEQARGGPVDARSDIYSFGVLLLELCTGRIDGEDARAELERLLRVRAGEGEPALRAGLLRIAARCLEPNPVLRFSDGTALLAALQALAREREEGLAALVAGRRPGRRRALGAVALVLAAGGLVAAGRFLAVVPPGPVRQSSTGRPVVRRLTANPPENAIEDAALSPDGRALAYVDRRGLWLRRMDPVRTEPVKLPERFTPQSVTWSPRNDALVVVGLSPGVEGSAAWRIDLAGQGARLLTQRTLSSPRLSSNGAWAAWITPEGIAVGPPSMEGGWLVVPAEHAVRLDRGFDQLSWSPDGQRLAFLRFSVGAAGAEASLEVVELKSGRTVVLVKDPSLMQENGHGALVWTAEGRLLYALAERPPHETGSTLWALEPEPRTGELSGPPRLLHSWTGSFPALLTASATGGLAYVQYESQVDVYVGELLDGGRRMATPQRITLTDHNERPSGWTTDGQGVLFMSDQDGSHDLFLQDVRSGEIRTLVADPDTQTWPDLAPGGGVVLYWQLPLRDDDQPRPADLMRVPLAGGAPVRILTTRHASREGSGLPPPSNAHFRCPAHGKGCVLGELDGSELTLSAFEPTGGPGGVLLRLEEPGAAHGWDVSPDGGRIALPIPGGRIRMVGLAGEHERQDRIVDPDCDLQFVSWAADGAGLFATGICPGERPYKVLFVERSRSPRTLWESSFAWAGHPVASPDGKALALAIKPFDNDVWLLTGL